MKNIKDIKIGLLIAEVLLFVPFLRFSGTIADQLGKYYYLIPIGFCILDVMLSLILKTDLNLKMIGFNPWTVAVVVISCSGLLQYALKINSVDNIGFALMLVSFFVCVSVLVTSDRQIRLMGLVALFVFTIFVVLSFNNVIMVDLNSNTYAAAASELFMLSCFCLYGTKIEAKRFVYIFMGLFAFKVVQVYKSETQMVVLAFFFFALIFQELIYLRKWIFCIFVFTIMLFMIAFPFVSAELINKEVLSPQFISSRGSIWVYYSEVYKNLGLFKLPLEMPYFPHNSFIDLCMKYTTLGGFGLIAIIETSLMTKYPLFKQKPDSRILPLMLLAFSVGCTVEHFYVEIRVCYFIYLILGIMASQSFTESNV